MGKGACLLLLGALAIAGCAKPAAEAPDRLAPSYSFEAEGFHAAGCGTQGTGAIAYAGWATEGLVVRLPRGDCSIEVEVALPVEARLARARLLGPPGDEVTVTAAIDGVAGGRASWRPDGQAQDVTLDGGLAQLPGTHVLTLRLSGLSGPADVDHVVFEAIARDGAAAEASGANATDAPRPTGSVGLAEALRLEAEDRSYATAGCDQGDDRVQARTATWASGGFAVVLPKSGCGIVFEDYQIIGAGCFSRFGAELASEGSAVAVRLRVAAGGDVVAQRAFDHRLGDAPFEGAFDTASVVAAGRHDLRIDYEVISGPSDIDLLLDFVDFRAGNPCRPP